MDLVDLANDRLQSIPQPRTTATHNFIILFEDVDGNIQRDNLVGRLTECFDRLGEEHGLDPKQSRWALGYVADEGNLVIRASNPTLHSMMESLLTAER